MSRSIFDPTGPNTERSGSTFSGSDASSHSHMPGDVVDGVVEVPAEGTAADAVGFDGTGQPVPTPGVPDGTATSDYPDRVTPARNPG